MNDTVPLIDLTGARAGDPEAAQAAARQIDDALCSIGFFVIRGHGIDGDFLARTSEVCRAFFDLPVESKLAAATTAQGSSRGYMSFGRSALARTMGKDAPGDYKESFNLGPPRVATSGTGDGPFYAPNVWPEAAPALRPALEAYYAQMEALSALLLPLFARALKLPPAYFDGYFDGHNSTLTVINYPAQLTAPAPGQMRAGAHTDYGGFTLLRGEDVPGGLQVRTRAGEWVDVRAPGDAMVVNIGDLMMRWTNDRWLSNLHQVANPPEAEAARARRQSIAFFANPAETRLIEALPTCVDAQHPAKYPPILAGEHRLQKIQAARRV